LSIVSSLNEYRTPSSTVFGGAPHIFAAFSAQRTTPAPWLHLRLSSASPSSFSFSFHFIKSNITIKQKTAPVEPPLPNDIRAMAPPYIATVAVAVGR
jgi:hypothetical protein